MSALHVRVYVIPGYEYWVYAKFMYGTPPLLDLWPGTYVRMVAHQSLSSDWTQDGEDQNPALAFR